MFDNLSIRYKMIIPPAVAGLAFCLVLAAVIERGWHSQKSLARIENGHYPSVTLNRDLEAILDSIQRQMHDAVSLEDPEELEFADVLGERFRARLAEARSNPVTDPGPMNRVDRQFVEYYALARATSQRMISGNLDEEMTPALESMATRYNAIRGILEFETRHAEEEIRAAFDSARAAQDHVTATVAVVLVICVLALAVTSHVVSQGVTEPVREAMRVANALSEGDLSPGASGGARFARADGAGDEMGVLMAAFGRTATRLRELVLGVRKHSTLVGEVANTLHGSSEEMFSTMRRQEEAVGEATRSIGHMGQSVKEVTGNVDTLAAVATDAAQSVRELNASIGGIADSIDRQAESIDSATSSVVQMSTGVAQIAASAEALSASTDSTTTALETLSSAVAEVEVNAGQTHGLSQEVSAQAELGMEKVGETSQSMLEIQRSFCGLERIISSLATKSHSIGEINQVIENLLEQTNLLALNAAIISAQAGEHGQAFAVVAEQVRNLADRTRKSTDEIRTLTEDVRREVDVAVEAAAGGAKLVDSGVALSGEAGVLLHEIRDRAVWCVKNVSEIVSSTSEQACDIEQVRRAMVQLRDIAEQLDTTTREQNNASGTVREEMERMREFGHQIRMTSQEQSKESHLITSAVDEVADRIRQIAEVAVVQSRVSDEIVEAIEVFRQAVVESRQRREEVAGTVEVLLKRSQDLESEVERFRV